MTRALVHPVDEEAGRTAPWRIAGVALLVRLLYMTVAHTFHVRPGQDHFGFGFEAGRIARALVTGFGYADPFTGHTGPTAWLAPLYPWLLAGIFKIFGVYTATSAWVALAIACVASAAIVPAIDEIAVRCLGEGRRGRCVALWSCWIWALYPAAMQYAVRWFWDVSIVACAFAWVLVLALRIRGVGGEARQDVGLWVLFGLGWGVIAYSNPSLLLFLPLCGVWMVSGCWGSALWRALGRAAVAGIVFLACLAPWTFRNYRVFHVLMPMRGNFGAELNASVSPWANGFNWGMTIPLADHAPQYVAYKQMGEAAYVRREGEQAQAEIRARPARFLRLSLLRFYFFWVSVPHDGGSAGGFGEGVRVVSYCFASLAGLMGLGLAWRRRVPAAGLFAWAFLLLPMTYYLTIASARFRHPLEPLITILGVYLFQSATPRLSAGRAA